MPDYFRAMLVLQAAQVDLLKMIAEKPAVQDRCSEIAGIMSDCRTACNMISKKYGEFR